MLDLRLILLLVQGAAVFLLLAYRVPIRWSEEDGARPPRRRRQDGLSR